jgi:hypothetical protein
VTLLKLETGGFLRRFGAWMILAVLISLAAWYWGISIDQGSYLGPKLTYMSVVIALGLFQYRLFVEGMQEEEDRILNPEWASFRRRVEREGHLQHPPVLEGWQRQIQQRDEWEASVRSYVRRGPLPHNVAVLSNIMAVIAAMLGSVLSDLAGIFIGLRVAILAAASDGLFVFTFIPVFEALVRYTISLHYEARAWERSFQEPEKK